MTPTHRLDRSAQRSRNFSRGFFQGLEKITRISPRLGKWTAWTHWTCRTSIKSILSIPSTRRALSGAAGRTALNKALTATT